MNPNAVPFAPTLTLTNASLSLSNDPAAAEETKRNSDGNTHNAANGTGCRQQVTSKDGNRISSRQGRKKWRQQRHTETQGEKEGCQTDSKIESPSNEHRQNIKVNAIQSNETPNTSSASQNQKSSNQEKDKHCTIKRRRNRRNKCKRDAVNQTNTSTKATSAGNNSNRLDVRDQQPNNHTSSTIKKAKKFSLRKRRERTNKSTHSKDHIHMTENDLESKSAAVMSNHPTNQIAENELDLEVSFPMLQSSALIECSNTNKKSEKFWSECQSRALAAASEPPDADHNARSDKDESPTLFYHPTVSLTALSSVSTPSRGLGKNDRSTIHHMVKVSSSTNDDSHDNSMQQLPQQCTETTSLDSESHASTTTQNITLSNMKGKWSDARLSKMRKRWWEAERAKRRIEDEKMKILEAEQLLNSNESSDGSSLLSSSSGSLSPSSDNFDRIRACDDDMQPLSLTGPYDEMTHTPQNSQLLSRSSEHMDQSPSLPEQILNLEQECLKSSHPLHFIVHHYFSLLQQQITNTASLAGAESVLTRLLELQDAREVTKWKASRVNPKDWIPKDENLAKILDQTLLSADITALSPLQLSVLMDLPQIVQILLSTVPKSSISEGSASRLGMEEDGQGRNPLMLACELHRLECIETLLALTAKPKLDHRENEWGNSAYHFCCTVTRSSSPVICDNEIGDTHFGCDSLAADALDLLLSKTPFSLQRKILTSINNKRQTMLHLACSSGDLRLVDSILEHLNAKGCLLLKALNMKDVHRHVPFLSAVAADQKDIAMHLLVSRFANGLDVKPWFTGCPLTIAAMNNNPHMVRNLLDMSLHSIYDINRALFETIRHETSTPNSDAKYDHDSEARCDIISLLISSGANPHLPGSFNAFPEQHLVNNDQLKISEHFKEKMRQGAATPLTVAVCSGDVKGVKTMLSSYSLAMPALRAARRSDPILRLQPDSYFATLEKREDAVVDSSLQCALVNALFLFWKDKNLSCAITALGIYKRGVLLSQLSIQWLTHCLSTSRITAAPTMCSRSAVHRFEMRSAYQPMTDLNSVDSRPLDWSKVLAKLGVLPMDAYSISCDLLRRLRQPPATPVDYQGVQIPREEDKFYLIVEGEKLVAHKSIVSLKSLKLAAAISFNEAQRTNDNDCLSVQVDLSIAAAKMLLTHIYHGSIVFGLKKGTVAQCYQLLELALLAEEYLCPSMLVECEMRLLKYGSRECICRHCRQAPADPVRGFIDSPCSGLITPETALDVLAVAQHLEQSSFAQNGAYATKYRHKHQVEEFSPATGAALPCTKHFSAPFVSVKRTAISVVLKNFKAVISSDSYLQQTQCADRRTPANDPSASEDNDRNAIMLLTSCLEELEHNSFEFATTAVKNEGVSYWCNQT